MTSQRLRSGLAVAAAVALLPTGPAGAAPCWAPDTAEAVAVRVLQSELTVGALVCGHDDVYAAFVERQSPALKRYGAALIAHYETAYGAAEGQRRLDRLATRLANEASSRKTDWNADYCAFLRHLTLKATEAAPSKLGAFAAADPYARAVAQEGACQAKANVGE